MDRRQFMGALAATVTCSVRAAGAQQQPAKIYRIAFLGTTSQSEFVDRVDAIRAGLLDLGYVEGKNYVFELRWADGDRDRLPKLAAELVQLNVDVFVTHAEGAFAAKQATRSIPIVMAFTADAMAAGLVRSLARPEGNITGSTVLVPETRAKRLELLKAAAPQVTRVAALVRKGSAMNTSLGELQRTGKSMNLAVQSFEVETRSDFERAFAEMAKARVDALLVSEEPMLAVHTRAITTLAGNYGWPSIGPRGVAEAGGLVGYGVDAIAIYRHSAVFIDKILRGAKPADLPVEQPTKFDIVINLKTARALGLTIPQALLLRADQVIQ